MEFSILSFKLRTSLTGLGGLTTLWINTIIVMLTYCKQYFKTVDGETDFHMRTTPQLAFKSLHIYSHQSYFSGYICILSNHLDQRLSQDLEAGCLKLAVGKFWGVQIFKGDHYILIFQP